MLYRVTDYDKTYMFHDYPILYITLFEVYIKLLFLFKQLPLNRKQNPNSVVIVVHCTKSKYNYTGKKLITNPTLAFKTRNLFVGNISRLHSPWHDVYYVVLKVISEMLMMLLLAACMRRFGIVQNDICASPVQYTAVKRLQ